MGKIVRKFEGVADELGPQVFNNSAPVGFDPPLPELPNSSPYAYSSTPFVPTPFGLHTSAPPPYSAAAQMTGYGPASPPTLLATYARQTQSATQYDLRSSSHRPPISSQQAQSSATAYQPYPIQHYPAAPGPETGPTGPFFAPGLARRGSSWSTVGDYKNLQGKMATPPVNAAYSYGRPVSSRYGSLMADADDNSAQDDHGVANSKEQGWVQGHNPPGPTSGIYPQHAPRRMGSLSMPESSYQSPYAPYHQNQNQTPQPPLSWYVPPPQDTQHRTPLRSQRAAVRATVSTRVPEDEILETVPTPYDPRQQSQNPHEGRYPSPVIPGGYHVRVKPALIEAYRAEITYALRTSLAEILQKNLAIWSFKLDHLTTELKAHIDKSTSIILAAIGQTEGGQILANGKGKGKGPYMRVQDPELRRIWETEGWRGSTKVSTFFQALQDYFLEVQDRGYQEDDDGVPLEQELDLEEDLTSWLLKSGSKESERWAKTFVGMGWRSGLQAAIDRDGSGYVSVGEVNRWSSRRPAGMR